MRSFVTWLLVAALAAIALFAARDALRSDGQAATPVTTAAPPQARRALLGPPPRIAGRAELASRLRELGARGALYMTDAVCRRFVLVLPSLRWTTVDGVPGTDCGFWAHPPLEESGIAARQVNEDTIEVTSGGWSFGFEGSSPAFKPDGTLTFVRGGGLYEWTARCPETVKIVRFEGLHTVPRCVQPIAGAPRSMLDVVWLTDRDYAAIAGPRGALSVLVVRGGRETRLFTGVGTSVAALQASPGGRYLAARLDGTLALFRTASAGVRPLPATGDELVRAIAWSQDDRVAAVATERSIDVFSAAGRGPVVRLPISAATLQWR